MKSLILKKGRESSLQRRHPWVFSGAIDKVTGDPAAGDTVAVLDSRQQFLAWAAWSPRSQIQGRVWSFDEDDAIDAEFIHNRIVDAIGRRGRLLGDTRRSGLRLVYGESDLLPGLVVDRYNDFLVCQFLTVGAEAWKPVILDELRTLSSCKGMFERSDVASRGKEGLAEAKGVLWGEAPPDTLLLREYDWQIGIDIANGHKTGYYLDQADNRHFLSTLTADARVLNCFSYTGGFAVAALAGGAAHVTNVDSSAPALALARANLEHNGFAASRFDNVTANVFELLRQYRKEGRQFDVVVLDPPKFADTRHQQNKAARAYKDIALQAAPLVKAGGLLMSYSCSGAIDMALFQKITADALLDAGRFGQVTHYLHQGADHPVALPFPESLYLKGLLCRLD